MAYIPRVARYPSTMADGYYYPKVSNNDISSKLDALGYLVKESTESIAKALPEKDDLTRRLEALKNGDYERKLDEERGAERAKAQAAEQEIAWLKKRVLEYEQNELQQNRMDALVQSSERVQAALGVLANKVHMLQETIEVLAELKKKENE